MTTCARWHASRCGRGCRCSFPIGISHCAPARRESADGFVAVEWVAAIALLLLPIVLLAATLPVCAERQHTAVVAAREAARALAAQWPAADPQRAEQIVREVAADHDVNPSDVRLHIRAAGARRGDVVVVDVDVVMPAIEVAGIGAGSWRYTARATRRIDDFRSR